jgi:dTDP-4-dehydrorhamnose reductase
VKILLLGKNGQVGWELQRALAPLGKVVALGRNIDEAGLCGDLAALEGLADTVRRIAPDVIVNAAAYTAVDKAENEKDTADLINHRASGVLAREALELDAWLVHYSTDYVFDGTGDKPWLETDTTVPVNYYGASKLAGEEAIRQSGCKHLIFRTSWVYAARGNNFAKTMLRLAKDRKSLSVISDQIGAPTGAELLADVVAQAIPRAVMNPDLAGTYHLAAGGETSWHAFAKLVIENARRQGIKLAVEKVEAIPTSAYPTPARRPLNSRLNTTKLTERFGLNLPHWEVGVTRMLAEINTH